MTTGLSLLCIIFLATLAPAFAGFALDMLCKVTSYFHSRSLVDVGGVYVRLFPPGRCVPVKASEIYFKVYPGKKGNSPFKLISINDDPEVLRSYFDPNLPTAVFSHGFLEGQRGPSSRAFKAAFLYRKTHNFLEVDWQKFSSGPWYLTASRNVEPVGLALSRLLDRLLEVKAFKLETLHILGFSLGAHVSGVAAYHLKSGRVPRITGLDPAYPLFQDKPREQRLDKSDAKFVDVIHSSAGLYGYPTSIGHVDFYPNSGRFIQPGCEVIVSIGACSHWRSWRFFEESLRGGEFIATKCDSWSNFRSGKCDRNPTIMMGIETNTSARGDFYLRTSWTAPFSVM